MILFDSAKFIRDVENMKSKKGIEYIDAVVSWCEKNKIEIEFVAGYIKRDPVMRSKLQEEAENLNILKRGARLPL